MFFFCFCIFWLTDRGLIYQFREVILTRLGENVNHTCDLSAKKPYWYDVNGQRISQSQYEAPIRDSQTQLILLNLTLEDAGVYFCNGTKEYGSLIIYVQGNLCSGIEHKDTFESGSTPKSKPFHIHTFPRKWNLCKNPHYCSTHPKQFPAEFFSCQ